MGLQCLTFDVNSLLHELKQMPAVAHVKIYI